MSAQILHFLPMAELPNRIRELRVRRDWSQDHLATIVGCSKIQVSELERGLKPLTVQWMRKIGEALEVPPGELLSRDDNPLILTEEEQRLLERYRSATPENRAGIASVAETLSGYKAPPREEAA